MSELVLLNVKYYVAGLDLSGNYNMHALVLDAEAKDFTGFGPDGVREAKGGLLGAGSEHKGFWDDPVDNDLFAAVGAAARVATITPDDTDGQVAYFYQTLTTEYLPGAQIGDQYEFSASDMPSGIVTRGQIMATGTKSADGNGTARQLGAVSSDQSIRAALHVLDLQGSSPALDVTIESDDASGMASATTQLTFTQATAAGGEYVSAAGAITDDWWRVTWDLGVDTTSALFVVAVGIG